MRSLAGILVLAGMAGCGSSPEACVERGNRFFAGGKAADAVIQYQKAIQKRPAFGEAHYRLGLAELALNQPASGYRELRRAVELMPGNTAAIAKLGHVALGLYRSDTRRRQQLYNEANNAAEQLLQKKPDDFDGNYIKGALALVDRKPEDAVLFLGKAVQAKPEDLDTRLGLARALILNNQSDEGLKLAEQLIRQDKTLGGAYDVLYEHHQASGQTADAENILKLKVSNNPKQPQFLVELARHYANVRNPVAMNATIRQLLDGPSFPEAHLLAGDFYSSIGNSDEALRQFEQGLGSKAKDGISCRRRMVPILAAQRRWPEAAQQLEAILRADPGDQEAKLARALVWLDEGKPANLDPAITELRAQMEKRTHDAKLHFQLGGALARKGDRNGALREWSAAAQQDRNYLAPRFSLVQMELDQGRAREALPWAQEILSIAPEDPRAHLMHAICLTGSEQYPLARTELNRLLARTPQSPQVRFHLARLSIAEGRFKDAEGILVQLVGPSDQDPQVAAALAEAYRGLNQPVKAIQVLQDSLKRHPDSIALHQTLAQSAIASRNYDLAIEQYRQLANSAPDSEPSQLSLAAAYRAKGDVQTAVGILEKAVQHSPQSVRASIELARALVAAGRLAEAKARYRQTLVLQSTNPAALNDLAFLLADSGEDLDEALGLAQRGLQAQTDPGTKNALSDTLGWIYYKKNMSDSALQTFQTLVNNNPSNATFRYHLGAALYQKGDRRKARVELEEALASPQAGQLTPPDVGRIRDLLARAN